MLTSEEHFAEGERWLQLAEGLKFNDHGSLPPIRAAAIATAHFTAALYRPPLRVDYSTLAAPVRMPDE